MATPTENVANIRGDQVQLKIGNDTLPFFVRVNVQAALTLHSVTSARTGADVIAQIVEGRSFAGEIVVIEGTQAVLQFFANLAAAAPRDAPAVGAVMPTYAVTIHNPADANDANDIHLYAVTFGGVIRDADGRGNEEYRVPFTATRDANGKVWRVGPAA